MLLAVSNYLLQSFYLALLILPVMAIIHMLQHEFNPRNKLIWILIIIFLPFFGAILYFILNKRYRRENP
ncbi:MAG: PLDc N-terminal domain-containing protein [Bacteroidota bacterium]